MKQSDLNELSNLQSHDWEVVMIFNPIDYTEKSLYQCRKCNKKYHDPTVTEINCIPKQLV